MQFLVRHRKRVFVIGKKMKPSGYDLQSILIRRKKRKLYYTFFFLSGLTFEHVLIDKPFFSFAIFFSYNNIIILLYFLDTRIIRIINVTSRD